LVGDLMDGLGFSALQRAENSSILVTVEAHLPAIAFQCSSASRKFLNATARASGRRAREFQCSSASRKFLNLPLLPDEFI